jgi:hypothetical protein
LHNTASKTFIMRITDMRPSAGCRVFAQHGESQDDVSVDSISVEEQVASSATREQSSRRTPRSDQKPT